MAQRIKGQEVFVQVVQDGVPVASLTDIRNFEITPKLEKLEEQYLGETTKRYDEIFNGVDFKFDLHFEDAGVVAFVEAVKARAQRQTPGVKFNIQATLAFTNGTRPRIILSDCYFSDLPISFGGRSEYGQFTVSGSCADFTRV